MPPKSLNAKHVAREDLAAGFDRLVTEDAPVQPDTMQRIQSYHLPTPETISESEVDTEFAMGRFDVPERGEKGRKKQDTRNYGRTTSEVKRRRGRGKNRDSTVGKHGRGFFDGIPEQVQELERNITALKESILAVESHQTSIYDRLQTLTRLDSSYGRLRNRFISTYKRDKLGTATDEDLRVIAESDLCAHGGDAVADASLYTNPGGRRDIVSYEKLYGLSPYVVQGIRHIETVCVLNSHAEVEASVKMTGTDKFYKLFWKFIKLFKESGNRYDEGYLMGNPTDVTEAYWEFVNCLDSEVEVEE